MEERGFVKVEELVYRVPVNPWSEPNQRDLGSWQITNFIEGMEGFSLALFIEHLGWSWDRLQAFLKRVKKDIQKPTTRAHWTLVCVIGQKPPEGESQSQEGRHLAGIAAENPGVLSVVNRCRNCGGI